MAVQPIRLFGDPVLRTPAEPVVDFDEELRTLVADLTDTMLDAARRRPGRAADRRRAAGVHLRRRRRQPGTWSTRRSTLVGDEEQVGHEGCLSIPGLSLGLPAAPARRGPRAGTCTASRSTVEGTELLARCVQHETDHLDGVLFVDRLDPETRKRAMAEIRDGRVVRRSRRRWSRSARTRRSARRGSARAARLRRHPRAAPCRRCAALLDSPARGGRRASPGPDAPAGRGRHAAPRRRSAALADEAGHRGAHAATGRATRTSSPRCARSRRTAARSSPTARWCRAAALDVPRHGWVNLHFSLLPAWRGAAPVQARDAGRRRGHRRDRRSCSRRAWTPGRCSAWSPRRSGPTDTARRPARPARRVRAPRCWSRTLDGIEDGTLVARAAAGRRASRIAPKITVDGRAGRLGGAGARGRPAGPRRAPRRPGAWTDVPRRAARARPGACRVAGRAGARARASCASRSGGCWSAPATHAGASWARCSRRASGRCRRADWARGVAHRAAASGSREPRRGGPRRATAGAAAGAAAARPRRGRRGDRPGRRRREPTRPGGPRSSCCAPSTSATPTRTWPCRRCCASAGCAAGTRRSPPSSATARCARRGALDAVHRRVHRPAARPASTRRCSTCCGSGALPAAAHAGPAARRRVDTTVELARAVARRAARPASSTRCCAGSAEQRLRRRGWPQLAPAADEDPIGHAGAARTRTRAGSRRRFADALGGDRAETRRGAGRRRRPRRRCTWSPGPAGSTADELAAAGRRRAGRRGRRTRCA